MQGTSFALLPSKSPNCDIQEVSPGEAVVLVEGGYATLVETRRHPTGRRDPTHIEGAMAFSLDEIEAAPRLSRLETLPKNQLLIVYGSGADDDTIHQAARGLVRRGADPTRVAILTGSPDTWDSVGLPVLRSRP